MLKYITICSVLLLLTVVAHAQYGPVASFIPAGYSILDSAAGDINLDGNADAVIILRSNDESLHTDATRPLLVLTSNASGAYRLYARNDSVLMCKGCGGVFGDPYAGITIKCNYFSIEHYGGSSWRWTRIITFVFDQKRKQLLLHKDAGDSWHTSDPGNITTTNFNREDVGKLQFSQYAYEKAWRLTLPVLYFFPIVFPATWAP